MTPANGAVLYRGPSLLTGDPILVAITGLFQPSNNQKTGPMLQTWILRSDLSPSAAVRSGADDAICGDCPHRSGSNIGRSCYVIWWQGPHKVWSASSGYPDRTVESMRVRLETEHVRMGSYGDPAAAPAELWLALARWSSGWSGYTHHWRTCDPRLRSVLMASVDSLAEKREASGLGWRTFRVRAFDDTFEPDEVMCPASEEAQYSATCDTCRLCGGTSRQARSVAILPHGQRVKWIPSREVAALV